MQPAVFEEQIDENYEPTEAEVEEYCAWLGLDPHAHGDMLWIAREGLKAPLPEEWKPCRSAEGDLYYYNFVSGQSSWEHPSDVYYKRLFAEERRKLELRQSQQQQQEQQQPPTGAAKQPAAAGQPPRQQLFAVTATAGSSGGVHGSPARSPGGLAVPRTLPREHSSLQLPSALGVQRPWSSPTTPQPPALQHARATLHPSDGLLALGGAAAAPQPTPGGWGPAAGARAGPRRAPDPPGPGPAAGGVRHSCLVGSAGAGTHPSGMSNTGLPSTAPGRSSISSSGAGGSGPKKVSWEVLVSTDPQPTATLPVRAATPQSGRAAALAVSKAGMQAGASTPSWPPAGLAASASKGSCGGSAPSYAQQMQIYWTKLAAAAAARGAEVEAGLEGAAAAQPDPHKEGEAEGGQGGREDCSGVDARGPASPGELQGASARTKADMVAGAQEEQAAGATRAASQASDGPGGAALEPFSDSYSHVFESEVPVKHEASGAAESGGAPCMEAITSGRVEVPATEEGEGACCLAQQHRGGAVEEGDRRPVPAGHIAKRGGDNGHREGGEREQQLHDQAFQHCSGSGGASSNVAVAKPARRSEGSSTPACQASAAPTEDPSPASTAEAEGKRGSRPQLESLGEAPGNLLEEQQRQPLQRGLLAQASGAGGRDAQQGQGGARPTASEERPAAPAAALSVYPGRAGSSTHQPAEDEQQVQRAGEEAVAARRLSADAAAAAAKGCAETLREQARRRQEEAAEAKHQAQLRLEARHLAVMRASLQGMKENVRAIRAQQQQGVLLLHQTAGMCDEDGGGESALDGALAACLDKLLRLEELRRKLVNAP